MGPHEPYWRTNSSFSPPPSRWDFRFQPDGPSFGSQDGMLYGGSTSSNSRESRSWVRGNHVQSHQYLVSDTVGPYFSSPSDISPTQQGTPPTIQEINLDDFGNSRRDAVLGPFSFSPTMEGVSATLDGRGSTSSRSDSSDYEAMPKSHLSHRNLASRRYFMSKPIHPMSFPSESPSGEMADNLHAGFLDFDGTTLQRDRHSVSNASGSIDFTDVSEHFDSDSCSRTCNPSDSFKCGLCGRLLSQRSPWSSRRIIRSGDMPVAGVLSCRHVFHAECLEQTTPKTRKSDPPCPLCSRAEEGNSPEQRVFSKFRNTFPRLKSFSEEGPSRPWGCAQAGDCVEGALNVPPRSTMFLLNRNRTNKKNNLSSKSTSSKDFQGILKKGGLYSSQLLGGSVDQGAVETSKMTTRSDVK